MKRQNLILLAGSIAIFLLILSNTSFASAQQPEPGTPTPDQTLVALVEEVEELSTIKDTATNLIGWAIGIGAALGFAGIGVSSFLRGHYEKKLKELTEKFEIQIAKQEEKYQQLLVDAFYKIDPRRIRIQVSKELKIEIELLQKLGFTNRDDYNSLAGIDTASKESTIIVFHIPGSEFSENSTELKDALRLLGVLEDLVIESADNTKIGFILYISGRLNQASTLQSKYHNLTFVNTPATIISRLYDLSRMLIAPEIKK